MHHARPRSQNDGACHHRPSAGHPLARAHSVRAGCDRRPRGRARSRLRRCRRARRADRDGLRVGYADAPRGKADAPWALPGDGLPSGFATLVPEIDSLPAAVRVTKRQMSAFFGTELDLQLRRRGCRAVVICGVATNMGVEATARAAFDLDYDVVIAADACGSVAPGLHAFAVENILPRIARVRGHSDHRRGNPSVGASCRLASLTGSRHRQSVFRATGQGGCA